MPPDYTPANRSNVMITIYFCYFAKRMQTLLHICHSFITHLLRICCYAVEWWHPNCNSFWYIQSFFSDESVISKWKKHNSQIHNGNKPFLLAYQPHSWLSKYPTWKSSLHPTCIQTQQFSGVIHMYYSELEAFIIMWYAATALLLVLLAKTLSP